MLVALHIVPVTAGEVGEGNGSAVVVHREATEFSKTAPFGEVVNIHVEGQTILEAVNHTCIHHVVHTTVAHLTAQFAILLDDGALILGYEGVVLSLGQEAVAGEVVHLGLNAACAELALVEGDVFFGILGGITLRTGELEQTVVGLGVHDVVLDFHYLAVSCTHEGGGVVAVAILLAGLASLLLHILLAVYGLGVHGYEGGEAVAAVDVEALCHGAKAVGGIDVAAVLLVVLHTPAELVGVIVGVGPVVAPEVVEVVDVGTFCADNFTEYAGLRHFEGAEFVVVVAAVFENHTVLASLLREVDEVPALLKVHGRGHFDGGVLAVLEGALSNGEMVVPVGCYVNEVDVGTLAEFLIAVLAKVDVCGGKAYLLHVALAGFGTTLLIVAESNNLHTGDVAEAVDGTGTAHTETYEGHANGLNFLSLEAKHVLLASGTSRGVDYDCTLLPMPLRGGRQGLCLCRDASQSEESRKGNSHNFLQVHDVEILVRLLNKDKVLNKGKMPLVRKI